MADNERVDKILVQYDTDLAAIRRVQTNSLKVRSSMEFVAQMAKQVDIASGKAGKTIADAFKSQTSARIAQFNGNLKGAVQSVDSLTASIEKAYKAQDKLTSGGGKLESLDRLATATQRGLSGVGLGGAGAQIVGGVGDFAQLAKDFPALKASIKDIPGAIGEVVDTVGKSGVGLIGSMGVLVVALSLAQQQFEATAKAAKADLDARQQALELIRTGSKEEIQARIDTLKSQREATQAAAEAANSDLQRLRQGIANDPTIKLLLGSNIATGLTELGSSLGIGAGELKAAKDNADAANEALNNTNTELTLLEQAAAQGAGTIHSETDALKELENGIKYVIDQRRFELDAMKLSTAQIKDRQTAIQEEMRLLELEIQTRTNAGQDVADLTIKWAELGQQEIFLTDTATKLADAREKEAEAAKFQEQQLKDIISAQNKYNTDVTAIEQRSLEQRAALAERYNEALANAAEAAADAAEKALEGLQDKRASLASSFAQDQSNAQQKAQLDQLDSFIEFQRDEARALRQHQRDIEQIRRDAARAEEDLIANRDFAGLFRLRRDTGRQIEDSNRDFNAEREEQAQAFRDKLQDQITQYAREREERAVKFQQDLADAQAQYQKELAQADINRRKALDKAARASNDELRLLGAKQTAELTAKRAAYQADLQLIAQSAQVRQQILQAELDSARRILAAITATASGGGGTGGGGRGRALGGALARGQSSKVNDGRNYESFTTAGKTYDFPRSVGIFQANQAGKVNSRAGGDVQFSQTVNISGASNPDGIKQVIRSETTKLLERYFGVG